jgi:tRNA dimethylallyltransferase
MGKHTQAAAIFIMGPTAAGKTELAVELAQRLPVDVISVDSVLVYRGMDIGTAKPEPELLQQVPHALVDICEPEEAYSAARFRTDALSRMQSSIQRGRTPLLVGGTMLYFRALEHGLSDLPESDPTVRERLQLRLQQIGSEEMHKRLKQLDPIAAQRIHANDPQRLLRALEVIELSGKPLSQLQRQKGEKLPFDIIRLVRAPRERMVLHKRIALRFDQMLKQGFEEEVRGLMNRPGFSPDLPSMRAVGYRQMIEYLQGGCSREEMREKGIIATRQLAKRQFTWLRKEETANWFYDDKADYLDQVLKLIDLKGVS